MVKLTQHAHLFRVFRVFRGLTEDFRIIGVQVVEIATEGKEALSQALSLQPDLINMDTILPKPGTGLPSRTSFNRCPMRPA
jgi:CheY-like chemotaxis protein